MIKIYTGDKKLIKQKIQQLADGMEIKYSRNIFSDLSKQYGLFFKPCVLYFIYDPADFNTKDKTEAFIRLAEKAKSYVVCIIETPLDKRGSFYKSFNKRIETLGNIQKEKTLDEKVQDFINNIETITNVDEKEAVSFLYKLFYNFRYNNRETAGYCINLVLTGKIKTDLILKLFLSKIIDNKS